MEWLKPSLFIALALTATAAHAESNQRNAKAIEVTLPTATNPVVLETDADGKVVLNTNQNFPPIANDLPKTGAAAKANATTKKKAKAAAAKATTTAVKAAVAAVPAPVAANAPVNAPVPAPVTVTTNAVSAAAAGAATAPAVQKLTSFSALIPADPSSELDPPALTPAAPGPTAMESITRLTASVDAAQQEQATAQDKPSLPAAAEAAVILSRNQFYPSRITVPNGTRVRIWFTTVETRPAALVVEGLKMQRWIASDSNSNFAGGAPGYFELQRELTRERVTEITLQPNTGTYPFFDALSGARGEIVVE